MNERIADETMLSFVCPLYNAEAELEGLHEQLKAAADALDVSYEIIFVNDGSTDETMTPLRSLAGRDGAVRYLDLSRRFGVDAAIVAGCDHAQGQATIVIDSGQSFDRVPTLIERWHGGWEIVHDGDDAAPAAMRLIDHRAAQALGQWFTPGQTVTEALEAIGFRHTTVPADREGKARRRPPTAWAQSVQNLSPSTRRLGAVGLVLLVATGGYLLVAAILALTGVMGISIVLAASGLIGAIQLLCLAGISECLHRTARRVEAGAPYVVRHRHGFGDDRAETPDRPTAEQAGATRFTVFT